MKSKFHRWWLGSCVAALLLASWVGGFSVAVTSVFIVIYLTGLTLIGPDEDAVDVVAGKPVDVVAAEPGWAAAFTTDVAAVAEPAAEDKDEPEPPVSAKVADEDGTPETDDAGPADAETVIVYESAAPADQETVIVEDDTETDTEAVTLASDEDDALPYPDDFDDEATAEVGERSPA